MTAQQLVDNLRAAGLPAYLDAAPPTSQRYVAVSPYMEDTIGGDDQHLVDIEHVQLDICTASRSDLIVSQVKTVLCNDFLFWDTVTPLSYDPEFKLFRAILQSELY